MLDAPGPKTTTLIDTDYPARVVQLLDEFKAEEFRSAERILELLRRQGRTISGYPRVRPADCDRVFEAVRQAFEASRPLFRTRDDDTVRRFDAILDAFAETDVRFYPRELLRARLLQSEAKLLLNDFEGVRRLISHFADRPYAMDAGYREMSNLMRLDCQARTMGGEVEGLNQLALARVRLLHRRAPLKALPLVSQFASFLGVGENYGPGLGLFSLGLMACSRGAVRARRGSGNPLGLLSARIVAGAYVTLGAICLTMLKYGDIRWRAAPSRNKDVYVTRAMGGIGDLLMMTPGLRALARRRNARVKLAVPRGFFPVFENNPNVELIDIDGPPLDLAAARNWYNLTVCPAGAYESRTRPYVKKGRVELFARGMGVRKAELGRHGWNIDLVLDDEQKKFCREFLAKNRLGKRPLLGVQPYSRDSYKDHPGIIQYIESLSRDYDVLLFHHVADGLPTGEGIVTTAGLPLRLSLALVSVVDAMMCVDSAFLHAAAAFDIPVYAMFGPTDGKLFTRHHKHAEILAADAHFPCAPCWRNEDMPCQLTKQVGVSPCVSSVSLETAKAALARGFAGRAAPVIPGSAGSQSRRT